MTNKPEHKIKLAMNSLDHPKYRKRPKNIKPEKVSTSGYSNEIDALQFRHLPLKKMKLKMGILQNHGIRAWHLGQFDLPQRTDFSSGRRTMHTLKKLPHKIPKMKIIVQTKMGGTDSKGGITLEYLSGQKLEMQQSKIQKCK